MRLITFIALMVCVSNAAAQKKYEISKINPELLKNANAVVRFDHITYEVKSAGKATEKAHMVISILNKNAEDMSQYYSVYDKFSSISQLKAVVYDKDGTKIKEFSKSDFKDRSLISDYSIYEDNRMKFIKIYETNYPYTVEFTESKDHDGILAYPQWSSLANFNVSVEKSSYQISIPNNLSLRYRESSLTKAIEQSENGRKVYNWKAEQIKAFKNEPLSLGIRRFVPWAMIAPNEFEYDQSSGNLNNWSSLGSWVYGLSKDGDVLTTPSAQKVNQLLVGAKNEKEKIQILYNYLQNSTRYVSVQLGIGGFKPIAANKVAEVSYGDCKGLSNYMKALLKEAGIKSELVLIKNQEGMNGSLNETFSSVGQANHMILCVPLAKDTVWLECTSQRMPIGYLGGSNSNRNVLLINETGGKIVKTPLYSAKNNLQSRVCEVNIDPLGIAIAKINTQYSHEQFEGIFPQMFREPKDQREYIMQSLSIANPEIINYKYAFPDKSKPEMTEEVNLKVNDLMSVGGDKYFLTLNLMNKRSYVPEAVEDRITDFALQMNYTDIDEISYNLPADFKIEFLPKDLMIKSDFGEYSLKISVANNKISYLRTQKMYSKQYPASRYAELIDFYKSIYKADKQKAVLSKI